VSARPSIPRLEGEELDLLISRSLDGDLSPEEARDLETVLANDPAARKRKEELAGLVAEARALPVPAPPFALSTRVNSNVSEKAARGGSIFHRFGFYPPPGFAVGAMVVLGIVAVGITIMNPAPKRPPTLIAQRADGPVEVFFQEGARAKAKVAANDALKDVAKKAAPAPPESAVSRIASNDEARDQGEAGLSGAAAVRPEAPASVLESKQVASVVASVTSASNEPALDEKQNRLAKSEADSDAARSRQASAESPILSASAPQASGAVAPAPAAAPAAKALRAMQSAPTRAWSVAIRGEGARRWMLRRAPEGRPPAASAVSAAFRITLDAEGRVTAVRPLDARAVQPALLSFVRGLVFAPVGSAGGAVVDGFARDREQRPRDERADAAAGTKADSVVENTSEIEVEVSSH
jgi:hypothetical protein